MRVARKVAFFLFSPGSGCELRVTLHLRVDIAPIHIQEKSRMPIKDGKRYCVNHPAARMNRTGTFKALVNIDGSSADGKINPNAGLVVMPFVCDECGYLELYVADRAHQEAK
jgi:hypothetical protein